MLANMETVMTAKCTRNPS